MQRFLGKVQIWRKERAAEQFYPILTMDRQGVLFLTEWPPITAPIIQVIHNQRPVAKGCCCNGKEAKSAPLSHRAETVHSV